MVVAYPQPAKAKSRVVCEAFVQGCGGRISEDYRYRLGTAMFYGVVGIEGLWHACEGDYVYGDNSFFDCARGTHFRFSRNKLQDVGEPDYDRLNALNLEIKPWRRDGRHIVVVMQSPHFMKEVARRPANEWQEATLLTLKKHTDRPIVVRHWSSDKNERARSLKHDLDGAWALVTHMSAAANEAVLAGIPVFVTGPCAALAMGLSQIESIETPRRPDGRREWAARLAAHQWTLDEVRAGLAWSVLNG